MGSTTFSEELANESLCEEGLGFFDLKDSVVGDSVREMEKRDFVFGTEDGLEFNKQHVLNSVRETKHSMGIYLISFSALCPL
jgi:hypothetical protein